MFVRRLSFVPDGHKSDLDPAVYGGGGAPSHAITGFMDGGKSGQPGSSSSGRCEGAEMCRGPVSCHAGADGKAHAWRAYFSAQNSSSSGRGGAGMFLICMSDC